MSTSIGSTSICSTSICSICRETVNSISAIYPCSCNYARHRACLYRWLKQAPTHYKTKCEVCLKKYSIDGPNSILNYNDNEITNYINNPPLCNTLQRNNNMYEIDSFGYYELSKFKRRVVSFTLVILTTLGYYIYIHQPNSSFSAICLIISIIMSECFGLFFFYKIFTSCRSLARVVPVDS